MLKDLKLGRQKYGLKKYLQRQFKTRFNKVFFNSDANDLMAVFREIGVQDGIKLCVHSSLSRLGYIQGGAESIIEALRVSVGDTGTLLMPAFSMGGNMASYLRDAEVFEPDSTPSRVGLIPETFRRSAGVLRSSHPSNSVCAIGPAAASLLADHELSETPYGMNTPYGRLAEYDDSYILMLDTHMHSFLHHVQERVGFPNLFLPDTVEARVLDPSGSIKTVRTRVMRPRVPYFVAVPSQADAARPNWAILHDYALMFPSRRKSEVSKLGYDFRGFPALLGRRANLESSGILRTQKLGRGEIGLLHVKRYLAEIQPEFEGLIERFREYYDAEQIAEMGLPYS